MTGPDGGERLFIWHEPATEDLDGAWAFYSGLFGWTETRVHDMGEMGPYRLFESGGVGLGPWISRAPRSPSTR